MQKTKQLLKLRNGFIPWFHWGKIHFILNTASMFILFASLCLSGSLKTATNWFLICILQYAIIFIVLISGWIFEFILMKTVMNMIEMKLDKNTYLFDNMNISVIHYNFHSCTLCVKRTTLTSEEENEFMRSVRKNNSKLEDNYRVNVIFS